MKGQIMKLTIALFIVSIYAALLTGYVYAKNDGLVPMLSLVEDR